MMSITAVASHNAPLIMNSVPVVQDGSLVTPRIQASNMLQLHGMHS